MKTQEYHKRAYYKVSIYFPKEKKEKIKAKANTMNMSVNSMINKLVEEKLNVDGL